MHDEPFDAAGHSGSGDEQAPKPITFAEVIRTLTGEAQKIRIGQDALVSAGLRATPYPSAIRVAEVLDRAADIVARAQAEARAKGKRRF